MGKAAINSLVKTLLRRIALAFTLAVSFAFLLHKSFSYHDEYPNTYTCDWDEVPYRQFIKICC